MTKIILNGYLGKMGKVIIELCKEDKDCEIVAGIDVFDKGSSATFPTFNDIHLCDMPADVIIDFSTHDAVPKLIDYCVNKKIPAVICTTGISGDILEKIKKASETVAFFKSANMSIGINLIATIAAQISKTLNETGFDIEIIEKHHNQKIDAPSGTALLLADEINHSLENRFEYVTDRTKQLEKRSKNEIGIHSLRGGTIVGEHSIVFAGKDEIVELTHIAHSKEVFAVGALQAAKFLKDKSPSLYNMQDIMKAL